jgi:hypothetical protein
MQPNAHQMCQTINEKCAYGDGGTSCTCTSDGGTMHGAWVCN